MQTQTFRQNLWGIDLKEYEILGSMSYISKNLYNKTLYEIRRHYFRNDGCLDYYDINP